MHIALIIISSMLLLCLFASKALYRLGVPSLLIFIILGMMMGSDGIGVIDFHNFDIAEDISSLALVFIMFYGGFGTKWSTSKSTALKAGLMSSLGTILTAITIGFFSSIILGIPFLYGLLLGAVVSPTDAASVFSILHSVFFITVMIILNSTGGLCRRAILIKRAGQENATRKE